MKKVLTILVLVLLPVLSFAQEVNTEINNNTTVETVIEKKNETQDLKDTKSVSSIKAQVIKINRKKSNEIISIKAFRKSLHIKVKEVAVC